MTASPAKNLQAALQRLLFTVFILSTSRARWQGQGLP